MEKYRKFEDPQNGINPFIPGKIKKRNIMQKILLMIQFVVGIGKTIAFISLYLCFVFLQIFKYILLVPQLIRMLEVTLNVVIARVLLILLGVWSINYKFKKQSEQR